MTTIQAIVDGDDNLVAIHDAGQKLSADAYPGARSYWIDDSHLVHDGSGPPTLSPTWRADNISALCKTECWRRLMQVLKDDVTQMNMNALGTRLTRKEAQSTLTAEEAATLDLLEATQIWVAAMQGTARDLAIAQDGTFEDDAHWPAPPAGLADLVAML